MYAGVQRFDSTIEAFGELGQARNFGDWYTQLGNALSG